MDFPLSFDMAVPVKFVPKNPNVDFSVRTAIYYFKKFVCKPIFLNKFLLQLRNEHKLKFLALEKQHNLRKSPLFTLKKRDHVESIRSQRTISIFIVIIVLSTNQKKKAKLLSRYDKNSVN